MKKFKTKKNLNIRMMFFLVIFLLTLILYLDISSNFSSGLISLIEPVVKQNLTKSLSDNFKLSILKNYDIVRGIRVIDKDSKRGKNPYGCIIPSIIRKAVIINNKLKFPLNRKPGEDSTFKRWLYKKTNNINWNN